MTTATINNTIFRFTTFTNRQTDKQTDKRKKIGLEINVVCAFLQSDRLIEKYDYVDDFIRVAERSVELFDGTMLAALELFESKRKKKEGMIIFYFHFLIEKQKHCLSRRSIER